jgi:hypothetical protein
MTAPSTDAAPLVGPATAAAVRVSSALERAGFVGWDPYDALASPVVGRLARTRFLRRAAIQTLKRSPLNARPLLRIPRQEHTKATALLVSAYARLARLEPDEHYAELAATLARRLADRAVRIGDAAGWGYDFDVQTRWGHYRRGEPNAVATAFSAHALMDAAELAADERLRDLVGRSLE